MSERPPAQVVSLQDDRDGAIRQAAGALKAGELVVLPTDTVYGLAAAAFIPGATARVFTVKRRDRSLALPVLVSRPRQAWAVSSSVPAGGPALAEAFWPGALTLILPGSPELEWDLGDVDGSIAVRVPDHPALLQLLEMAGPLATSSANVSGEATPPDIEGIRTALGDEVAVYVDGGPAAAEVPSTIVDLTTSTPVIVREGAIPTEAIKRVLAGGRPEPPGSDRSAERPA